jgi:hypothetical protein
MIDIGWQVRLSLIAVIPFAAPLPAHAEQKHRMLCPTEAPAEWGLSKPAPLVQAAVLSQPVGQPIDDNAPPSFAPDQGFARGSVWHNVWIMGDEPGWSHFVDCQSPGSKRIQRLEADGLKQCEQTAQPYSAKGGVADNAVQTMVCD